MRKITKFQKSKWYVISSWWFKPLHSQRYHYRRICYCKASTFFALIAIVFIIGYLPQWILPRVPPPPPLRNLHPCHDAQEGYILEEMGICTNTCGRLCFPRVHGICFSHTKVTVCDGQPPIPPHVSQGWGELPKLMRFYMEKPRQKVPVQHDACPAWNSYLLSPVKDTGNMNRVRWIKGLQMVADLTLMPTGRVGPNPHHEAEKVIPAIVFSQLKEFENSSLYWFANPDDPLMISKWSLGLLDVFADSLKVKYLEPVGKNDVPLCFEDAILFTGVTNSGYMPNRRTHDWIRSRVLDHCKIPEMKANRPVKDAIIVHRPNSSRNIANYEEMKMIMEERLAVPVKMAVPGPWSFCDQVRLVAEADIILTPHGSQNANLLVVRPGATVMEVFPLLYYIGWYGNYLHASRVHHYELFGTWPLDNGGMPFKARLYAYLYGWQNCFYARHCMDYGKSQRIYVDLAQLDSLLQTLTSRCEVVVPNSDCT